MADSRRGGTLCQFMLQKFLSKTINDRNFLNQRWLFGSTYTMLSRVGSSDFIKVYPISDSKYKELEQPIFIFDLQTLEFDMLGRLRCFTKICIQLRNVKKKGNALEEEIFMIAERRGKVKKEIIPQQEKISRLNSREYAVNRLFSIELILLCPRLIS